tara:strand:- start:453 stop:635 length:183 start_codon:yes stop_codon:yes gene_type:complete
MQDKVKHHLPINTEVHLHMQDREEHLSLINIEVLPHMQDKAEHLSSGGTVTQQETGQVLL